jgi:hypothetical protein
MVLFVFTCDLGCLHFEQAIRNDRVDSAPGFRLRGRDGVRRGIHQLLHRITVQIVIAEKTS